MKKLTFSEFENTPKIIIGSMAGNTYYSSFRNKPGDVDYFLRGDDKRFFGKADESPYNGFYVLDAHGIPENIFDAILQNAETRGDTMIISCNDLFTLKVSHAHFNIHWDKTMRDIKFLQSTMAAATYINSPGVCHLWTTPVLNDSLYDMLYNYWMKIHKHGKNRINLNKTNEDFFDDNVKRLYIHDDLHEAVKYRDKPMYWYLKSDKNKAWISEKNFRLATYDTQLFLAREEIMVTALERFYIPHKTPLYEAYHLGAQKLVCSLSKGWFPQFIIENWNWLDKPDKNYIREFEDALSNGKVRKI